MLVERPVMKALQDYLKGKKVVVICEYDDGSIQSMKLEDVLPQDGFHYLVDVPAVPNPDFEEKAQGMISTVLRKDRLTTYHAGVAVIKDKSLLKDAMAKLAKYEDVEEELEKERDSMEVLMESMSSSVCDGICHKLDDVLEVDVDKICDQCEFSKRFSEIHNIIFGGKK